MILAEKIILLRKQNGWSQEELAEQMNVSRQSVSKWESGASIPDLDKILKMSELFAISTDYLLKDELENITYSEGTSPEPSLDQSRSISLEEANSYMDLVKSLTPKTSLAISGCILSPVALLFLGGLSEYLNSFSEEMAAGIGVAILLLIIAPCVGIIIINSLKLEKYEYLEKELLSLQYGVEGIVEMRKNNYENTYHKKLVTGIMICILSVLPILLFAGFYSEENDFLGACLVCVMLVLIAAGAYLIICSSTIYESYEVLLQTGDYQPEKKNARKSIAWFSGAYWCLITAVYLGINFYRNCWDISWILWPVAALLYTALRKIILHAASCKKNPPA